MRLSIHSEKTELTSKVKQRDRVEKQSVQMLETQLRVDDQGKPIIMVLKIVNECTVWRVSIFVTETVENWFLAVFKDYLRISNLVKPLTKH